MRKISGAALMLALSLCNAPAAAMHPLLTDDVATAEADGYELEVSGQWSQDRVDEVTSRESGFGLALTWGLGATLDLGVATVYGRVDDGEAAHSGLTDSYLTLKWRFLEADAISLAVVPYLALPTGDGDKGLGSGKLSYGCNLVASRAITDQWNVNANLAWDHINYGSGYDNPDNQHDLWRVSGALDTHLSEAWVVAAEVVISRADTRSGSNPAFATLGVAWSASKAVDLSLGYRFALNRAEIDRAALLAATFYW